MLTRIKLTGSLSAQVPEHEVLLQGNKPPQCKTNTSPSMNAPGTTLVIPPDPSQNYLKRVTDFSQVAKGLCRIWAKDLTADGTVCSQENSTGKQSEVKHCTLVREVYLLTLH